MKNHGGKREGAGRKPSKKERVRVHIYVDVDQVPVLEALAANEGINQAEVLANIVRRNLAQKRRTI